MINLYYCTDYGLLKDKEKIFLSQNNDVKIVNFNNHKQLIFELTQNSLFLSPNAYIIKNALFLSEDWKDSLSDIDDNKQKLKINNETLRHVFKIILSYKKNNKNVLILVKSNTLLNNLYSKEIYDVCDNKNFKIPLLTNNTKIKYLENLLEKTNFEFENLAKKYFYELISIHAWEIYQQVEKLKLFPEKKISLEILNRILYDDRDVNFFELIDAYLINNNKWIEIYNNNIHNVDDVNSLIAIYIYKLFDCSNFLIQRKKFESLSKIANFLNKREFMLQSYEFIYKQDPKNCLDKLNKNIIKLYEFIIKTRNFLTLNVQNFKLLLLSKD